METTFFCAKISRSPGRYRTIRVLDESCERHWGGEDAGDGEVNGVRGYRGHGHGHSHGHDEHNKEKEDKKTLTGVFTRLSTMMRHMLTLFVSDWLTNL